MITDTTASAFAPPPRRFVWGWNKPQAIGIVSPSYGTEKVSYALTPKGYSFHKLFRVPLQRLEKQGTFWHNTPILLDHPVSLVHTFNELPVGARPFVVSFENELPRYLGDVSGWQIDIGERLLQSARCRQILALSEVAAKGLREHLQQRGLGEVANKVSVFRGSVMANPAALGATCRAARPAERLRILFVGRSTFRKGLIPMLDALDDCRLRGADVAATVVCDFRASSSKFEARFVNKATTLERMSRMPGVTHHHRLSNAEIHKLMRTHDVLVFPTLDESLGWVAVEAGLAGMPIITTDIYALPELVLDQQTGFLLPLSKNATSRWVGMWLEGKALEHAVEEVYLSLRAHLVEAILKFVNNPGLVSSMGEKSRLHITSMYDQNLARQRLERIYAEALA